MTNATQDPKQKILGALKRHEVHIVEFGRRIHHTYPVGKIDPEVFQNITVPVPLPVAMMLYGLASVLVAEMPAAAKEPANAP